VINYFKRLFPINLIIIENLLIVKIGNLNKIIKDGFFKNYLPSMALCRRNDFLLAISKNKRLLHIGFLDAPITAEKINSGDFLHTKLTNVAASNYGVDINSSAMSEYRKVSGDFENSVIDILQSDFDIINFTNKFDVILLPEVLEHLPNPGIALHNLRKILKVNLGSILVITVPNAFSKEHFAAAVSSVEMVHPDHYFYFSPVTLKKLLSDSGFEHIEISLYAHNEIKNDVGITSNGIIALCRK
jgi:SAM-dependent methyltransferase